MNENMGNEQPRMLVMDRQVFIERVKAFKEEEWQIVMRLADTRRIKSEYFRRTEKVTQLVDNLTAALGSIGSHTTTEEIEDVVKEMKELLKMKE